MFEQKKEQCKKVCETSAVQCYQCFSLRLLYCYFLRAELDGWRSPWSYTGQLLTAAGPLKKGQACC